MQKQTRLLTKREAEVLELCRAGFNSVQSGRKIQISPKTVRVFLWRARQKLGDSVVPKNFGMIKQR